MGDAQERGREKVSTMPSETKVKLSEAQREALKCAITTGWDGEKTAGHVQQSRVSSTTVNCLLRDGLIERGQFVRDTAERERYAARRTECINAASELLAIGHWTMALTRLLSARSIQETLDAEALWITAAGRKAVEEA
jgi:hypothetical protein